MGNNEPSSPRILKTVVTATEVIYALVDLDGAGVTELANHIGISKSTAYTYLKTLQQQRLVTKQDDIYRLSYEPLLLGEYVRNSSLLYNAGRESVDELAETVGHYAHLTIEENGYAISIYEARRKKAVDYEYQATKLERRDPLHITASGKAILAFMSDERIEEIVARHGLDQWTERTITKREILFEEIEKIRGKRIAYNDEEEIAGFRAVAAPIRTGAGTVVGSVSISGPTSFFNDTMFSEELPEQIRDTANKIEVAINMTRKQSDISRK